MTTKAARIKSTTSSAPANATKKTDAGINYSSNRGKRQILTSTTEIALINQTFFFLSVEPYHCKGKFLEDFDALCRQAQITYIVPVVQRPRAPGTPMTATSVSDGKEKLAPKTVKGAANAKDRDALGQQHSEIDSADMSPGLSPTTKFLSLV